MLKEIMDRGQRRLNPNAESNRSICCSRIQRILLKIREGTFIDVYCVNLIYIFCIGFVKRETFSLISNKLLEIFIAVLIFYLRIYYRLSIVIFVV